MKTIFDTPEDIELLEKFLMLAVMYTERIFDPAYSSPEVIEYRNIMINWREQLYEWLESKDPNLDAIEWVKTQIVTGEK